MRFLVDEVTKIPDGDGRSLVLFGEVERGTLRKGITVQLEILGLSYKVRKVVQADGDHALLDEASAGQQVGVILDGLQNVRVQLGEVLVETAE